ncbi:MAG: type III pantothenate kinase [Tepidisphaera sp.]|nr:type III pantothenate kinase [Tepidisphaera sp.]
MEQSLLAIAVGNTRTRFGLFEGKDLSGASSLPSDQPGAIAKAVADMLVNHAGVPILISSVNTPASEALRTALESAGDVYMVGSDIPIPLTHALDDASTLGQDRALCALAAYARAQQACVVVDVGTAVTVDFIDGEGIFQGGVIAPGLNMMLKSLHEHTAALPLLEFAPPDPARGVFGLDTRHAMILGVQAAVRGLVREAIERYAQAYEAYPQIVATGGDAALLFENDDLIEHIVPDLQLVGILEAANAELDAEPGADPDSRA